MDRSTTTFSSILKWMSISILIALFVLYAIYQARFLILGPQVHLTDDMPVIQTERQVTLIGHAENITDIEVNGRAMQTDADGDFAHTIVLENGYNVISIRAHDRYGRVTVLEKEFVYTPLSLLPQ